MSSHCQSSVKSQNKYGVCPITCEVCPKSVEFLGLANPHTYTGHTVRRSAATAAASNEKQQQGSLWSGHLNLGQLGTPATTLPDTSMPPPAPRSPWSHEPIVSSVSTGPTMSTTPTHPPTSDAASVRVSLITSHY